MVTATTRARATTTVTASTATATALSHPQQFHRPKPETLSVLTLPLCTVGWLANTEIVVLGNQPIYQKPKKIFVNSKKIIEPFKKIFVIQS